MAPFLGSAGGLVTYLEVAAKLMPLVILIGYRDQVQPPSEETEP